MTPTAVTTMASTAAVQAAPPTTVEAVAPAPPVATALAAPMTVLQFVTGLLATNTPVPPPAEPSLLWGLLAWVRRELERTSSHSGVTVPAGGTTGAVVPTEPAVAPAANTVAEADNVQPTPPPPQASAPPPSQPLFVGAYSSGDFSQWNWVQNIQANTSAASWPATGRYPAQIVNDARGPVARFEVRPGDRPGGDPTTVDRSEVAGGEATGGAEGQLRGYAFSVKFDPTFPANTGSSGSWGVSTNVWHANGDGSPLSWHADGDQWELRASKASSPGVYPPGSPVVLWQTPIAKGQWHDIKMVVKWSTSDDVGYVQLWHNGVRQQLLNGSDTYRVRTLIPGYANPRTYYKEGIYREASSSTAIVYHADFRSATDEASL